MLDVDAISDVLLNNGRAFLAAVPPLGLSVPPLGLSVPPEEEEEESRSEGMDEEEEEDGIVGVVEADKEDDVGKGEE